MKEKDELITEWLHKADHDLGMAELAIGFILQKIHFANE